MAEIDLKLTVTPELQAWLDQAMQEARAADPVHMIESAFPGFFWHIARGRLSPAEPLYACMICEGEKEIGCGEGETLFEAVTKAIDATHTALAQAMPQEAATPPAPSSLGLSQGSMPGATVATAADIRDKPEDDDRECCIACEQPIKAGDMVYDDAEGGTIHATCCGPERESYTGPDGEPLKDGDPIPEPWQWPKSAKGDQP